MVGSARAIPVRLRCPFSSTAVVLWGAATVLDALSPVLGNAAVRAAFLDAVLGTAVAVAAAVVRRADYARVPAHSPQHGAVLVHALMHAAALLLVGVGLWRRALAPAASTSPVIAMLAGAAALLLIGLAGRAQSAAVHEVVVVPMPRRRTV